MFHRTDRPNINCLDFTMVSGPQRYRALVRCPATHPASLWAFTIALVSLAHSATCVPTPSLGSMSMNFSSSHQQVVVGTPFEVCLTAFELTSDRVLACNSSAVALTLSLRNPSGNDESGVFAVDRLQPHSLAPLGTSFPLSSTGVHCVSITPTSSAFNAVVHVSASQQSECAPICGDGLVWVRDSHPFRRYHVHVERETDAAHHTPSPLPHLMLLPRVLKRATRVT